MGRFTRPETAYLTLRVYLCLRTLVVAIVSLGEPDSLNGRLIEASGATSYIAIAVTVFCAVVGLLDVVVNDILPDDFHMRWARNHRHLGYIGLALGNCAFLLAIAKADTLSLLAISYFVDAVFAVHVAVGTVIRNQKSKRYPYVDRRKERA